MPGADHRRQKSKRSKRSASGSNKEKTMDSERANSPKDNTSELDDEIQAEYVKVAVAAADKPTSIPEHEAQDEKTALTESDAPPAPPPHQQEFLDDLSFQREIDRYNSPEFEDYLNKVAKHYPDVLRYIDLLHRIQRQRVEELEVAKHKLQTDLHKYKESYKRQHQELQRYQDHYRHQQQHGVDCGHGRKELAHDYDKDRQAHELAQLKIKLENLQTHALSSVDTFQPMPDSEIVNCLKGLGLKVEGVVKAVSNMKSSLSDDAWKVTLPQLMWQNTVNAEGPQFEYENKGIRRKALRNVVWWFVNDRVVEKPLKAFDGVVSANVNLIYRDLYPKPHQDPESANWRSMTATSLNRMVTEENDKALLGEIQTGLSALLETLGYCPEAPEFQKKSKDLVDGALKLARILAQQRAIFKLFVPMPEDGGQIPKMEDDELMTSVERDGDDEEAGVVWFVSRPGFTKWGTGTGDDLDKPMHLEKALVELI